MEELRSSEILDKEIATECRKKAQTILEKANKTASLITDGVSQKLENAIKLAEEKSKRNLEIYSKNENASLPLEKQRYAVYFVYNSIINQINAYFENLSDFEQLEILEKGILKSKSVLENRKIEALVFGFKIEDVQKILKNHFAENLKSVEAGKENLLSQEAVSGFKYRKGILIYAISPKEPLDKIICRFTLDEKVKEILDKSCNELGSALFGGRIPE